MPLERRELVAISGAAGVTALAGCYLLREATRDGIFDGDSERDIPSGLDVLHIRSGDDHVIADTDDPSYGMIRWEDGGRLTIEAGGSLGMEDINDG